MRQCLPLLAMLTLAAGPAPALAQDRSPLEVRLQARRDSLHAAGTFPGAVVGVALADGRVLRLATGWADTAARVRMRPTDLLLAGSVGKTFFAALAWQLVRDGHLELDAPISRWLGQEPWFPRLPNGAAVTVRMLMTHTSGLVRYEFQDAFIRDLTAAPDRIWRPEEQLGYLLDQPAPFAAGQGWEYSDTNFLVLGMILERITGRPAYQEIRERFLAPLQLTGVIPSTARRLPGLVQGYAGAGSPFGGPDAMLTEGELAFNPQFEWAGGGFATNAGDLAAWARTLYTGGVVDGAVLAEALRGVPARIGPGVQYGLGVILWPGPPPMIGHSGFFPGYLSEMRFFPADGFAIALQVNTSVGRALGRPAGAMVAALAEVVRAGRQ